jgi:hypothetical protein
VRTLPDPESPITGYLDVSEKVEILEGPVCSSTWIWWRVRSLEKNLSGWTAEGDAEYYWLVPMPEDNEHLAGVTTCQPISTRNFLVVNDKPAKIPDR